MNSESTDRSHMRRALELARRAQGQVEPNPMVGCVIVADGKVVGEGWHQQFGGPHAEIEALESAGYRARGATMYVTLEPCCHRAKTPPCTAAILQSGVSRVVVAHQDPFPQVDGAGLRQLREAGVDIELGILESDAARLNAPFCKLMRTGRPWVIAKWAMTLDGKLASPTGDSRWISSPAARNIGHQLRGRVDGIVVGSHTVTCDNPLLTARPPGPRVAARIVIDSQVRLSPEHQLVKTIEQAPVFVAVSPQSDSSRCQSLQAVGCELVHCPGDDHLSRLDSLLQQLGARKMTNLLVEGGSRLLGNLFDLHQIDEIHAFIATKLIGGRDAVTPIAGIGIRRMDQALPLIDSDVTQVDGDLYVQGIVRY